MVFFFLKKVNGWPPNPTSKIEGCVGRSGPQRQIFKAKRGNGGWPHTIVEEGEAQSGPPNLKWQRGELIRNTHTKEKKKKKKIQLTVFFFFFFLCFLIDIQSVKGYQHQGDGDERDPIFIFGDCLFIAS